MFTARRTTEGVLTLRGRAAFVAKFLTPCSKPKPRAHMREAHSGQKALAVRRVCRSTIFILRRRATDSFPDGNECAEPLRGLLLCHRAGRRWRQAVVNSYGSAR
jgi:hypothetical protein